MQTAPIHFMTVRKHADRLAAGDVTSVELTRHFLESKTDTASRYQCVNPCSASRISPFFVPCTSAT